MSARVQGIISRGTGGLVVDIECGLSNNLPKIVIVGFANKAVDESKERIRGAFADSRLELPRKRITINLAPAELPKTDSGFDLAIAASILLASGQVVLTEDSQRCAFIGELGLDGSTRAVRGIIGKLLAGRAHGISHFYIPAANLRQARLVPGVSLTPLLNLSQLYGHLSGVAVLEPLATAGGHLEAHDLAAQRPAARLSEIVGQAQAKRALAIAAAGGHNVFLSGPPGTGKSMLAKALPALMPPLNHEEILEVTHLHSLASHNYDQIVARRPFRAPHHSASHVAVTGGGAQLRPGEISLAHRGILLFDELPEFSRMTLEALRQPLEDRVISVARAKDTAEYPANFIFVATANPCPCGYYGTAGSCRCHPSQVRRYRQRVSGPILDRIDLYTSVHEIDHEKLLHQPNNADAEAQLHASIAMARRRQARRFKNEHTLNADMTNADIKRCARLDTAAASLLNAAAIRLSISARAYMRCVKVARTIADLDNSAIVTTAHIGEALAYRSQGYSE